MKADDLLVSTRFAPPRIGPRYVMRRQLLEQLNAALPSSLVLVVGGAGFGKTVLLAQWRQELLKSGVEVGWLSLSHEDEHRPRFCAYFLAAMQRLGVPVEAGMFGRNDDASTTDAAIAAIVNGAANLGRDAYLIVDDYHQIDDPWVHRFMQRLLDLCPPNLHLVIASRSFPPLNVSRQRVAGRVAELGPEQLPFDLPETRAFFESNLGPIRLSLDEVQFLYDLTDGWPASLQLLATMIKSRPRSRLSLRGLGGSSRDLQAYLAEDVVSYLPEDVNAFIEKISICRRFCMELGIAVTGDPRTAEHIRRLEEENVLIYPVETDDGSPWYRFHPLFREFLSKRLSRLGQDAVDQLHRRASHWFASHGLLSEAVRHATLANDLQFAVEVIEDANPEKWDFGFVAPTLGLLERLPAQTLLSNPRLFILSCLTFALTANPGKAERWIARATEDKEPKSGTILALAVATATLAWRLDDTARVAELLEPLNVIPHQNAFVRYVRSAALASAHAADGNYALAHRLLDECEVDGEAPQENLALLIESSRASTFLIQGHLQEAEQVSRKVLARAEASQGRYSVSANLSAAILGEVYYERDRIDDAREVIAHRPRILEAGVPETMIRASVCRARLDLIQESADSALAFLASHATHYQRQRLDRPRAYLLAEQVKILLETGKRQRATELLASLDELEARHRHATGFWSEIPALAATARARMFLSGRLHGEALACLEGVRRYAESHGRLRLLARSLLMSALALGGSRRGDEAATCLVQALDLGSRLGLIRTFLDEGDVVQEMLAGLPARVSLNDAQQAYLEELLSRTERSSRATARKEKRASPAESSDGIALTPREAEILSLICQAMTNKRIALTLNITLETVKWNVKNIFSKLGVSSRYEAIAWARRHGQSRG